MAQSRGVHESRPWGTISAAVIGLLFAVIVLGYAATHQGEGAVKAAKIKGVVQYTKLSRNHVVVPVNYPQTPPVGGDHNPVWQNCRAYPDPVANEHAVHSMEHGAVWITYNPSLPKADVTRLQHYATPGGYVLVSPYPGLPSPVVASAWGVQLRLSKASDPRLVDFVHNYEQGTQTPEKGSPCSGGTNETAADFHAHIGATASPSPSAGTPSAPAVSPTASPSSTQTSQSPSPSPSSSRS